MNIIIFIILLVPSIALGCDNDWQVSVDERLDTLLEYTAPSFVVAPRTPEFYEEIYGIIRKIDDDKELERLEWLMDLPLIGIENDPAPKYIDCEDGTDMICMSTEAEVDQ